MAGRNTADGTKSSPIIRTPKDSKQLAAEIERLRRRKQSRGAVANLVTAVMLVSTLVMLAYVAYQLNNPVTIYVSKLFGQ